MKISSIILVGIIVALSHSIGVAQVQRYDRLCTDGDDYSTAFRVTKNGMEVWLNTSHQMKNKESRRLVRVQCSGGAIGTADVLPSPINQREENTYQRYLDGSPTFPYCDTTYGIFASNRLNNGTNNDNDLYEINVQNGTWNVRRLDVLNSDGWDDSPTLSKDGNLLYFASSRGKYKGTGLTDIYVSRRSERGWETPQLVADICTDGAREEAPFIGSDGYLYFSTDRDGDMDIYRIKIDEETGNVIPPEEPVPYEGVNMRGSDEGVPTLSAGGAWLLFSSNRKPDGKGKKDYDIYMVRVNEGTDNVALKVELRTRFFNKVFEDWEDQTLPCTTEVITKDVVTNQERRFALSKKGIASISLPRSNISEPCMDYRYRQIVLSATPPVIEGKEFISERDTVVIDVMSKIELSHNFYVWDKAVPEAKECIQNFRVTEVQFFLTCYWCPTTMKYAQYGSCQSVFKDTSCTKIKTVKPVVQCKDGDVYAYKLNYVEPTVTPMRVPGICIPTSEMNDEQGKIDWSVKVDSAIDKFVSDMRSALQRPCVQRAIRRGEVVNVSVIGWTDPRGIDPSCLYTGESIDFNKTWIELKDLSKKAKYMPGGVLKSNTAFAKSNSGSGGNELLSDVRAYYTAAMLDSIWTKQVEEYRILKNKKNKQIHVIAVGSAIKQEQKDVGNQTRDYALRRSVNVVVSTPGDNSTADALTGISGRLVSLTGAPCTMLLNRTIQAPLSVDHPKTHVQERIEAAPSTPTRSEAKQQEKKAETEKKDLEAQPKQERQTKQPKLQEPAAQPQRMSSENKNIAVKEKEHSSRCRVILYNQYNSEDDAYKMVDQLRSFGVQSVTKTYFDASKRKQYRVISACYENDDDLYKELLRAKDVVLKNNLDATPSIILSPDQIAANDPNAVWSVVIKSYVREEKEQFVTRITEYIQSKPKYEYSNEQSQQLSKPEPWLASTSTIWYFSEETKQKALELARELTALTGISFSLRRGTGSSYGTTASRTLTIHLVLQ